MGMLKIQLTQPSSEQSAQQTPSLADLSRNASVISSGSSSSSTSSLVLKTPPRPRPIRTFSSPRSRSPHSPGTPRLRPPYLAKELAVPEDPSDGLHDLKPGNSSRVQSRAQSKNRSRNSSVNGRFSIDDFQLGETLGEGSYSIVRPTFAIPASFHIFFSGDAWDSSGYWKRVRY
jgi:3-phosphoinositide dependent protein kinase-1